MCDFCARFISDVWLTCMCSMSSRDSLATCLYIEGSSASRAACGVPYSSTRDVVIASRRESQRQSVFLLRKTIIVQSLQCTYSTFLSSEILGPVTQFYVYCICCGNFTGRARNNGTMRSCHVSMGNPTQRSCLFGLPLSSAVPEGMHIVTPSCQQPRAQLRLP